MANVMNSNALNLLHQSLAFLQRWTAGRGRCEHADCFSIASRWTKIRGIVSLLFGGLLIAGELKAHDVIWWIDPNSSSPVMDFYYPSEFYDYITVAPSEN